MLIEDTVQKRPSRPKYVCSPNYFPRVLVSSRRLGFFTTSPGIHQASGDDEDSKRHLGEQRNDFRRPVHDRAAEEDGTLRRVNDARTVHRNRSCLTTATCMIIRNVR